MRRELTAEQIDKELSGKEIRILSVGRDYIMARLGYQYETMTINAEDGFLTFTMEGPPPQEDSE